MIGVYFLPAPRNWQAKERRGNMKRKHIWKAGFPPEASALVEDRLYLLKVTDITVKVTAEQVTVAYAGSSPVLGGLQTKEQEKSGRKNPVNLLRKTRLLKELAGKV